jgi:hypothetical protein
MKKKKASFTLIEVLIAVSLTIAACFFLLDFEESYVKNARASLMKVKRERLINEAYVALIEQLYQNQIPWKLIEDKSGMSFPLSDPDWTVDAEFSHVKHKANDEMINQLMHIEVSLGMRYLDQDPVWLPAIRFCLKKEGELRVETPKA